MNKVKLAKLANQTAGHEKISRSKLKLAIQTIVDELGIKFGNITIQVHCGRAAKKLNVERILNNDVLTE